MKQIQPVSIWYNGQMVAATIFNLISISDNLSTSATFYYSLLSAEQVRLAEGNLVMDGADYATYSSSATSNDFAYTWAAGKLNLTLV
jgi:hypothetical protein